MSPYIGYDSDTTFIPGTLNTSSSLTIQGGGITQTGGDVNFDSGTLFIDEDLNRVGIGTTQPIALVEIKGNPNTLSILRITGGTSNNEGAAFYVKKSSEDLTLTAFGDSSGIAGGTPNQSAMIYTSNVPLHFYVGGNYRAHIATNGNVGIGTTNPVGKLDVWGDLILDSSATTSRQIYFRNQDTSATGGGQIKSDQHLSLWAANAGGTTPTQYLTIQPGGNVGIGITNPGVKLDVNGDIRAYNGASRPYIYMNFDTTPAAGAAHGRLTVYKSNQNLYSGKVHIQPQYYTGSSYDYLENALVVDAYGHVGINTANPGYALDVVGDHASNAVAVFRQSNASNEGYITIDSPSDSSIRPSYIRLATGNVTQWSFGLKYADSLRSFHIGTGSGLNNEKFTITPSGNVGIGITSPASKLAVNGLITESTDNSVSYHNVVTAQDIGTAPNQVPINAYLGTMAFQDSDSVTVGSLLINNSNYSALSIQGSIQTRISLGTSSTNKHWSITNEANAQRLRIGVADDALDTNFTYATVITETGNVGIGTTNPLYKLQVEGSVFINNSDLNANRNVIKGTGNATAPSTRLDNYKTFTNGVYQDYFRFTRSSAASNNNKVGVAAGMLHIVYINDRLNAVQTTGYDCFPIIIRGRSADVMSGTIGPAIADVHDVIGSAIQVQFANATTTTIDLQIYIYNSDGGGDERLCHAWVDLGLAGTDTDRLVYPSVL